MYIGLGIFLLVIGAIVFAVDVNIPFISDDVLGIILIAAGLLAIVLSFAMRGRAGRGYTATRQSTVDPATGTRVERTDVDPGV
ncbi:DUF6458 family protein [uncultured Phycicoccus sp.]|uniref:DUF6458 family protein n=1 Tax=uncultured Phycicoccus sp. TaxID=661422 RepID=UPI0026055598|nr:DUF6458 family protein [uncultured Phycicoccus sp.]